MKTETLYLKLDQKAELEKDDVYVKDLGKCYCSNETMLNRIKVQKVFTFRPEDKGRRVVSALYLIRLLKQQFPELEVENIGETDVLVQRIRVPDRKGIRQILLAVFVCGICFFGSAFTIMAFHNDIGIGSVFEKIFRMVTGQAYRGYSLLEICYSLGLAVGIIVFFNHVGGRRITKDPTPIEVEMRIYEEQVNTALTETADREGKTMDVN